MILGIGLDLCEIRRIEKAIEKARFVERVYTPRERERIAGAEGTRRGEIAAGLFAAKEAVSKALGTGFDGFGFDAIEIVPDDRGRPTCALYGRARALAGPAAVHVTITHDSGMAAATAILEGADPA